MTIIILTPDRDSEWISARWPEVLARMVRPLKAAGFSVEARSWTNAGPLNGAIVLPLLAWGYHQAGQGWHEAVARWTAQDVRLHNPASVLRWNVDKLYLEGLGAKGAPVIPTRFVDRIDEEVLTKTVADFGTDRLVLKPQVSAGAWRTIRWSPGEPFDHGPTGHAMIQPYLPSIETDGEVSMIFFGGQFSHAIVKRPQPGDFRVQLEYDGTVSAYEPTPEEVAAAQAALAAVEEDLLYARIDLVRGLDGAPSVIELELIEPDLYLGYDAEAPARFVQAVKALSISSLRAA